MDPSKTVDSFVVFFVCSRFACGVSRCMIPDQHSGSSELEANEARAIHAFALGSEVARFPSHARPAEVQGAVVCRVVRAVFY